MVAQGSSALEFVLRSRAELWPGVPVIFAAVDEQTGKRLSLPPDVTGTLYPRSFRDAVAAARVLVPDLKRIALVGDPFERQAVRGHYKQEIPVYAAEFELIDLMGLSMAELAWPRYRVIRQSSTQRSISMAPEWLIDHMRRSRPSRTWPIGQSWSMQRPTWAMAVPVALLRPLSRSARRRRSLALRILDGEDASKIPVTTGDFTRPVFDWRQLQRFGISEQAAAGKRDPLSFAFSVGAIPLVHHRSAGYYLGSGTLIVGLLLQRARRRRAEAELRESQEFMELSTSAGELGLWARDLERGDLWTNVRLRSLFGFGQNDVLRFEDLLGRIHPEDRARVIAEVERQQQAGVAFEGEFRVVIPDGSERWVAAKGRTVEKPSEKSVRRMGVVFDITERKRAERDLNAALVEIRGLKERLEEENIYLKRRFLRSKVSTRSSARATF